MPVIKALYGQSLADVIDEQHLFDAADLNSGSITDDLPAGDEVEIPVMTARKLSDEIVSTKASPPVTRTLYGQTWVDLAMQQLGTEERLFELVDMNDSGITDPISAGTIIQQPALELDKKAIVNVMQSSRPASEKTISPGANIEEGIEYWAIEFDFAVN